MAHDLTQNLPPERPITPELSPELKRRLDSAGPNSAYEIARDVPMLLEAQAMLPVLKAAATQLAGEEGVRQVIGRRFAMFPQPARSDGEWAAWWADYYDVLAGVPWAALEAGMLEWVSRPDAEFMPKPGKLLELSRITPNRAARNYETARKAVDLANPASPREPMDEAEAAAREAEAKAQREKVAEMMAEFRQKFAPRGTAPVRAPEPASHGKIDERGITPEMRALLARRAGE